MSLSDESFAAAMLDKTVGDHGDQWTILEARLHARYAGKYLVNSQSMVQSASIRCLNYRAVGDRVAIRKADLNQAGATFRKLRDQKLGGLQIRIAGRDEGNESLPALAAESPK